MWRPGYKLVHPYNTELGTGIVQKVDGRFLQVYFPLVDQELTLAAEDSGLTRLVLKPGQHAEILETGEEVEIAEIHQSEYKLRDGRMIPDGELWPLAPSDTPLERLASLRIDSLDAFRNRSDGLRLMELRETGGLGSFLGGRIELFGHQLHAALQAVAHDPVRWLLADEVGLGKTIEACLILSALIRTGRAKRALIVAPESLVVQWLGELYRKFHQIFVILDADRIESVSRDYGEGVNPFEVHPHAVVASEVLLAEPSLQRFADEAGLDLIVIDEAHRLAAPATNAALAPLISVAKHVLLLTATPLQADHAGFFQLLSLLHPDTFLSFEDFEHALQAGQAVIPCASAVRRQDIGGLPPRVPIAIDLDFPASVSTDAGTITSIKHDPRAKWLRENAKLWRKQSEKALVFVHDLDTLLALQRHLEAETKVRVFVFHEAMSSEQRDIDLAMFRESASPLLLCSEAGEEGRNFQFCRRMVHYDLPTRPVVLEQRIGRLDRIGRKDPVEIVYFRRSGESFDLAKFYESLDLFGTPGAGLELALSNAQPLLEAAMTQKGVESEICELIERVRTARTQNTKTPLQVYYRDGYDASQAQALLAQIPAELEKLTQRFCVQAARELGFDVVDKSGVARFYIEIGAGSRIDALPGVAGGTRLLGTFDRGEAIAYDELEFFASGHPLVEGLLLELEDGPRGRATLMDVPHLKARGAGLFAIFKDANRCHGVALDTQGKLRPDWVPLLWQSLPHAKAASPADWNLSAQWAASIRKLGERLPKTGELVAAAFFRFVN